MDLALKVICFIGATTFGVAHIASAQASDLPVDRPPPQAMQLDLSAPFHSRSGWRFVVTEGEPVKDYGDMDAPGALTLCLRKGSSGPCLLSSVSPPLWAGTPEDPNAWGPHYLHTAEIVYPRGLKGPPLLMIVTGSVYSGDGDQVEATQLIRYDASRDAFRRIYAKSVGHNNNQEIRFVKDGPLRGSVIVAEPQQHAPFAYTITVNRLMPDLTYRRALRYRSATRYADGNPLAVIDSEMPNIQRRLGLWKPGERLPAPTVAGNGKPCTHPTLKNSELWCE